MYQAIQDGSVHPAGDGDRGGVPRAQGLGPVTAAHRSRRSVRRSAVGVGGYARNSRGDNYVRASANPWLSPLRPGCSGDHVLFTASDVFRFDDTRRSTDTVIYCDPPIAVHRYRTGEFDTAKAWRCIGPEDLWRSCLCVRVHRTGEFWPMSSRHSHPSRGHQLREVSTEKHVLPEAHPAPEWRSPNLPAPGARSPANPLVGSLPVSAPEHPPAPRVEVPDHHAYYPHLGVAGHRPGRAGRRDILPAGAVVAVDTETMGLGADSFTLKFTAAWETPTARSRSSRTHARDDDAHAAGELIRAPVCWSSITPRLTFPCSTRTA